MCRYEIVLGELKEQQEHYLCEKRKLEELSRDSADG